MKYPMFKAGDRVMPFHGSFPERRGTVTARVTKPYRGYVVAWDGAPPSFHRASGLQLEALALRKAEVKP